MANVEATEPVNKGGMQAPVQRYLAGVVATVSPDASLREVARKLMAIEAGALVVGTCEAVQGVISGATWSGPWAWAAISISSTRPT
ncbi:MAG: hypothetical protein R2755_34480 [Acidimicrobiales bacterium]